MCGMNVASSEIVTATESEHIILFRISLAAWKLSIPPKNDAHEPPLSLKVFCFFLNIIFFFWRDSGCTFENSELCSPAFESKQEHLNQHFLKPFFFLPAKLQILSSLPGVVPFPYLELNARAARHSRRQLPSTTSLTVSSWLYWSTLNPLDRSSRIRGVFFLWEMFRWEVPETLTWASTCVFGRGFFGTFRYDFFLLLGVRVGILEFVKFVMLPSKLTA